MSALISNGMVVTEDRYGWERDCPKCGVRMSYTILNISPGVDVYLYCDKCSNFVLREEDRNELMSKGEGLDDADSMLDALYRRLEQCLDFCECGGRFRVSSNVKCPSCHYEFPYNHGVLDMGRRYREAKLVWVEGAIAYRGGLMASSKLGRVL